LKQRKKVFDLFAREGGKRRCQRGGPTNQLFGEGFLLGEEEGRKILWGREVRIRNVKSGRKKAA